MSKLNAGETPVILGDEKLWLKPSLRATTTISRQYGGLAKARQELVSENFDAVVYILRNGLNLSDRDAKDLPDRVYANGITIELLVPLIKYVAILGNGGKPFPDEPEDNAGDDGDSNQGND